MARRRDRALVLRRFPFGESSLVVHALTPLHGRVNLLARGAYRPRSRFSGVLDLFDTLDLAWTERGGGLGELREGDLVTRRRAPTRDLERYRAASAALELAGRTARENEPEPGLFAALEELLDLLGEPGRRPGVELLAFDLALLDLHGLAPALTACAACGRPAPPVDDAGQRVAFSASSGGRLCRPCATEARRSGRRVGTLPLAVVAGARRLSELDAAARGRLPAPPPELFAGLRDFVDRFLAYHLESRLRARVSS